jgi:myxalamid-type nonribosomal peptide synthetase MxaA
MTASDKLIRHSCEKHYLPKIQELYATLEGQSTSSASSDMKNKLSEAIGGSDLLSKLGTDSLSTVRLAHMIKSKLGVTVSLSTLQNAAADAPGDMTVDSLAKVLESSTMVDVSSNDAASKAEDDSEMELDTKIYIENLPDDSKSMIPATAWKRILITGATGFLGFELMLQLLETTSAEVVCLIRPQKGDAADGKARLASVADARFAADRFHAVSKRIVAISADLDSTSPTLGVPGEAWNDLCSTVDCIFHCGAAVNWVLGYDALRAPNVLSTKSLLDMAVTFKLKSFFYVSTISTSLPGQLEGSMMPPSALRSCGAYALSKWAAEKLVRRASYQGLPAFVFKPGMITGHSKTGASNPSTLETSIRDGDTSVDFFFFFLQLIGSADLFAELRT